MEQLNRPHREKSITLQSSMPALTGMEEIAKRFTGVIRDEFVELVGGRGLEPRTNGLKGHCSTD